MAITKLGINKISGLGTGVQTFLGTPTAENLGTVISLTFPSTGTLSTLAGAETLTNKTIECDDNVVKVGGTRLMSTSEEGTADVVYLKNNLNVPYLTIAGDNQGIGFLGTGEHQLWAYAGYIALNSHLTMYPDKKITSYGSVGNEYTLCAKRTSDGYDNPFITFRPEATTPTCTMSSNDGSLIIDATSVTGGSGYIGEFSCETIAAEGLTEGSVLFAGASGALSQSNSAFYFNSSRNALMLGSNNNSSTTTSRITSVISDAFSDSISTNIRLLAFNSTSTGVEVQYSRARGTVTAPASLQTNDFITKLSFRGYNGASYSNSAQIWAKHTDTGSGAGCEVNISLCQNGASSLTSVIKFAHDLSTTFGGNVSGGTYNKITITAPATAATLTLANNSSLITSGAFSTTLTATATTNVTLPTTGTLSTLAGVETLTNKTIVGSITNVVDVTTSTQTMVSGTSYIANATGSTTVIFTLPTTNSPIGSIMQVTWKGNGGWQINQSTGQSIKYGDTTTTTTSGSLSCTSPVGGCVTLLCTTENTIWRVIASHGTLATV